MKHLQIYLTFFLVYSSLLLPGQTRPDQLDLATPYDAMWVHLYYLQPDHYQPGLSAEAFTGADSLTRIDWAIKLKQILDGSGLYVHMNQLPREADYIDSISRKHFYTPFPDQLPQVYLEKIGDRWFYAEETTSKIVTLHKSIYPFGTDLLLHAFGEKSANTFLGISVWQYAGAAILLVLAIVVYFILTLLFRWLIRRLSGLSLSSIPEFVPEVRKIANLASYAAIFWILRILMPVLQLPPKTSSFLHVTLRILMAFFFMLLVLRAVNVFSSYLKRVSEQTESRMDDQLVPVLKQVTKVVVVLLAILYIMSLLEFNVTALIAGLSIGGLALALAAQDTVKNFLGSVMIFADRPFQIGDWVEGDGFVGTVAEVGFRSTRIRTSETSVISVPNGSLANVSVNNRGARVYRLFSTNLGLMYDTPASLLEFYMEGIKKILLMHPEVSNDDIYVRFTEFAASSLNIFVRAYLIAPNYQDELRIKESINLAMLRWAEALGANFAFPTTTVHVESFPGQIGLQPNYQSDDNNMNKQWQHFAQDFETRLEEDQKRLLETPDQEIDQNV